MTSVQKIVEEFDFEDAQPYDVAVLLEQIFMRYDSRSKDGGPILVAQSVIKRYEESVRKRAAPELHSKTSEHCRNLRSVLVDFESSLRRLEQSNGMTR